MYKITIDYKNYICSYGDLTEILVAFQKIRELEPSGNTKGLTYTVEEIGAIEDFKQSEIARLRGESDQRQKWWLEETQKTKKLEARIKELESTKVDDISF